jgi:alanyl-tRNA synthetase
MSKTAEALRQGFIEYFKSLGHQPVPSASLIPQADPTLLFTNAGMNQFKRVFLGEEERPYTRAVTVQKCVRAGGKHNDLENVGYTTRHHTFFEMLGNFSFGDYFKAEAIRFAWDFLTHTVGLPPERLWVTVFREDDEAYRLWTQVGVPASRILRFGEKDNFWQMAETGPCGPCSEIHFDQGPSVPGEAVPNGQGDRVIEIWNLVFMQFDRDVTGKLHPLPKPSIDTGMGLERLAAVAQGVSSNYESDLFTPLLEAIGNRIGCRYGDHASADRSMRVIADHLRAITFLIADGILPSNEGRGYVLRRILRRAARHGRLLGLTEPFLSGLTGVVVEQMGRVYPELGQMAQTIAEVTQREEERFLATLDQGLPLLAEMVAKTKRAGGATLAGDLAFKLYDTYGFPLDLIVDACREQGMTVDEEGFQQALHAQRERARKARTFETAMRPSVAELARIVQPSTFVGYEQLDTEAVVQALLKDDRLVREAVEGEDVEVVLDVTPFYPEGGGQVGDQGTLTGPEGRVVIQDTARPVPFIVLHRGTVAAGRICVGQRVQASVNPMTRHDAARNHTATHLVHAALREVLGPHVKQYGSLVAPNRLRFDFAHFRPLSSRDIDDIEGLVNEQIRRNLTVRTEVMALQEALASGALAFFEDKYGDRVRVVSVDTFSKELCGGTHCRQTGEIGVFRLISETGIAAGVRRIECLTGGSALEHIKQLEREVQELAELLRAAPSELVVKAQQLIAHLKERERELEQLKLRIASEATNGARVRVVGGIQVYAQRVEGMESHELRRLADQIRNRLPSGVIALGSVKEGKASLLVMVTKDLTAQVKAGDLIKELARVVGGAGGGRPELAQAGGRNPEKLDEALETVFKLVERLARQ